VKAWPALLVMAFAACRLSSTEIASESLPSSEPPTFVEPPPGPVDDPVVPTINEGECPPRLAQIPEPYFGARVLLRLPEPMSATDFVEVAPHRAQLVAPVMLLTCKPDRPNVALDRMIAEWVDSDPGAGLVSVRDGLLRSHGMLDGALLIEAELISLHRRMGQWVFATPTHTRLVVLISGAGGLLLLIYEVAAADWPLVVDSLRETARRASFLAK
jgi:hypothetical protein